MLTLAPVDDALTLRVPQFFCCNCGEAEEIRAIATSLGVKRIASLGNAFVFQLDLPYCRRCASTAARRPVGLAMKGFIAGLFGVSIGVLALITPLRDVLGVFAFYLPAATVFAIVLGCYSLRRPKGKQTSYDQPVRLVDLKRQPSGSVDGLTLSFTHARYARSFASANAEAISRGTLGIVDG